jgi:3-hydroxyacyl-[acyl-carrier-protein] dehydratase
MTPAVHISRYPRIPRCGKSRAALYFSLWFSVTVQLVQADYLPMRFSLIDRIDVLQPGSRITAVKNLSMAEEYLKDHFPGFPVMPGVLMLEAMAQASAWLVRASEDFAHSIVVLKEARGVKYGQFVEPGQTLQVTAEIVSQTDRETVLKAWGEVCGQTTVSGKLTLQRYNLGDTQPHQARSDVVVKREMRELFDLLYRPCRSSDILAQPVV